MDEKQALLKQILVANKIVQPSATSIEVAQAHASMMQTNPVEYRAMLQAAGYPVGPSFLMMLGLVGGAIAIYFIWKNHQSTKLESSDEYPEPNDARPRLRQMGRALAHFKGAGKSSCRSLAGHRRFGNADPKPKYEFEPEIRLEGYRRRKRRS